jgi:hypothetical protein
MAPRRVESENPFRVNSPRNVLSRARERWQLISEWLKVRREERQRASGRERDPESRH